MVIAILLAFISIGFLVIAITEYIAQVEHPRPAKLNNSVA